MLYVYVANLHQDCIAQAVTDHQMIHFWYLSELTGHPRAISSTINMRLWEATEDLDRHPDDCVDDWESKIQCVPSWSSVHSMHKHWQRMSSIQHRLIRHPRALSWPQHAPHFFFSLWKILDSVGCSVGCCCSLYCEEKMVARTT